MDMSRTDDLRRAQAEWLALDAMLAVCARDLENCTITAHAVMHDPELLELWSECRATHMALAARPTRGTRTSTRRLRVLASE